MHKIIFSILVVFGLLTAVQAQKYITKTGAIEIFSETSLFTIEAKNQKVGSILNAENGEVVASTLVRSFKFHEALVEEHFNENYMESHTYPKSIFKGKVVDFSTIDILKNGTFAITIEGDLTLHGETNKLRVPGKLVINDEQIAATTEFTVSLAAYKIAVEEKYKDRIKDEIKLTIHFDYKKLEKK